MKLVGDRPGHQHVVVAQPFDAQARRRRARPRLSRSVRPRFAAATAAAQAPVPQARVNPTPRSQTRRRSRSRPRICAALDVGTLRKQRMPFDQRPEMLQRQVLGVVDEEHGVRIADVHRHRIAQRARLHRQVQGIDGLGQRNIAPVESDAAHVDAD